VNRRHFVSSGLMRGRRAAAVSLVLIAAAGCSGSLSPSATPQASASATSGAIPLGGLIGPIKPGTYLWDSIDTYRVTVTVPDGWSNDWALLKDDMSLSVWEVANTYRDPCKSVSTVLTPPLGPTVQDLVAALEQQVGTNPTAPKPVTVAGHAGQLVELDWPSDIDVSACEGRDYRLWVAPGEGDPSRSMSLGAHTILWIVDVDGSRLVIDADYRPGAAASAHRAELQALVDSIRIESTSAVVPAMTEAFTSANHGYAVGYPADWTLEPATSLWWPPAWKGSGVYTGFDRISAPVPLEGGVFRAASAQAPEGVSIDDWIDEFIIQAEVGTCNPSRTTLREVTIDSQRGRIRDECPAEVEATVVVGRRVYVFTLFLDASHRRAVFDAFAATIDLRPEDAVVVPSPTPPPS